jgi:hypothetical protein
LSVATGATLDLSGGGSLFAYEFTAGKGGSQDILANPLMYAVNPAFRNGVAPVDAEYGSKSSIAPGSSVYLSGVPGLPAGVYTLLPGHYALMQGSFAVTAAAATRDIQPEANTLLPDGVQLVSGRMITGGSGGGDTPARAASRHRHSAGRIDASHLEGDLRGDRPSCSPPSWGAQCSPKVRRV